MKAFASLFVSLLAASAAPLCAQTSVQFSLGAPGENFKDSIVFASGGVTATATAWSISRTAANPTFEQSQVSQWSPGIGVRNSSEVITDTPYVPFYVDNEDHYDFILFVFSKKVDIASVTITPSSGTFDLDASYWLGNVNGSIDLTGSSRSSLSSLGFGSKVNDDSVASHSARTLSIDAPSTGVNAILFGARVGGDSEFDRFKIASIQGVAAVPEPTSVGLLLGSLALLVGRRRR